MIFLVYRNCRGYCEEAISLIVCFILYVLNFFKKKKRKEKISKERVQVSRSRVCILDLLFAIFCRAPTEFPLAYRVKLPIKSMSYGDLPV